MDYNAKLRESRLLTDKGMYTQAVFTLGNLLENLYLDFYSEVMSKLPAQQRRMLLDREQKFAESGDRNAKEKGFAGFPLGGKARFFRENDFIKSAESVLGRAFPRFRAFDDTLLRDLRNEVAHGSDAVVDEDEANLFYSQVRVLLLEVGLIQKAEPKQEVVAVGGLRSWKENGVIPHDDILGGNLQMDTYAADLWGVARNDSGTPVVYREADKFFAQTYLTHSLQALLTDVMKVLRGSPGDRVLQLRTPFGGGKTHTLIALYHAVKNRSRLPRPGFTEIHDLPDPGTCAVAAVQCDRFSVRQGRVTEDGIHIHTLWGEIAYQLGGADGYAYLQEDDEHYTSPGGEDISRLLRDLGQPALILLDEILNHVETAQTFIIGDSTLGRQLMIFLKNLTEAVSASPNAALVYSLQASIREGLGAENLLATLDHLVSRVDAKREPVSGGEIMRVVQRRLFKQLGDESAARQTAAAYADAYRRARQAVGGLSADEQHQAAEDANKLADRILESYPFHPDLLDLMYHRWGTLPSYQRTRGALQFLASVIYDLWESGRDLQPLIGVGDVPLDADHTRNAFFTQIGEREAYTSVFDVDFISGKAGSARVDRRIASDSPALQRFRVGTRLATSIMLYSFGAREGEERGVTEADLIQAATVPGLERMALTTALNDLRNELLYMHYTGRRYRFETQPNLNKLIDDETKKFDANDISKRVYSVLEAAMRGTRGAVLWPADDGRVNDRIPMFQIVYLPLDWTQISEQEELLGYLTSWIEKCGSGRRVYKNGLAFAVPNYLSADSMYSAARELLAIESLMRDKKRFNFSADQMRELTSRETGCSDRLNRGILSLYDRVAIPVPGSDRPYTFRFIELQSRSDASLHARVIGALKDEARLIFDTVTPDKLIALMALTEQHTIKVDDVIASFFSYFNFPHLTSDEVVIKAVSRGVAEAKFGYTAAARTEESQFVAPSRELIYFGRLLPEDEIEFKDAYLLDATLARELTYVPPIASEPEREANSSVVPDPVAVVPGTHAPAAIPSMRKRVRLIAQVDKSKVFKLYRVLQNLTDRSQRVEMSVEFTSEVDEAYDPVWLRNAVEEPLDEANIDTQFTLE